MKLNKAIIGNSYKHKATGLKIEVLDINEKGTVAICKTIPLFTGNDSKIKRIGRVILEEDYTKM